MDRLRAAWFVWAMVSLTYVAMWCWAALRLPDPVPSHFDGSGQIDDWMSKPGMLAMWAAVGAGVFVGLPALCHWATAGKGTFVNVPHKDYWFAPERKADFRRAFLADMLVMSALTGMVLMALLALTTLVATLGRDGAPGWIFWLIIGAYLIAMGAWTIGLLRRYRPPA
ncbi:MAG: DUF1648 domain-containing protein [Nocardioides sp.]|jgi:uncharacterized membrane protein